MNPQPKPLPRSLSKAKDKAAELREEQRIKRLAKARDGFRCRVCGKREGLDGHEEKRRGAGGPVSLENTYTACRVCHDLLGPRHITAARKDGREPFDANKPLVFTMSRKVAEALFSHRAIPAHVRIEKAERD